MSPELRHYLVQPVEEAGLCACFTETVSIWRPFKDSNGKPEARWRWPLTPGSRIEDELRPYFFGRGGGGAGAGGQGVRLTNATASPQVAFMFRARRAAGRRSDTI